jgi:hypothetical protein
MGANAHIRASVVNDKWQQHASQDIRATLLEVIDYYKEPSVKDNTLNGGHHRKTKGRAEDSTSFYFPIKRQLDI